jgi:hypothetical protein
MPPEELHGRGELRVSGLPDVPEPVDRPGGRAGEDVPAPVAVPVGDDRRAVAVRDLDRLAPARTTVLLVANAGARRVPSLTLRFRVPSNPPKRRSRSPSPSQSTIAGQLPNDSTEISWSGFLSTGLPDLSVTVSRALNFPRPSPRKR